MKELPLNQIIQGDCLVELKKLPDECVDCIITSPPYYGLRDYGVEGQVGSEKTLKEYLDKMLPITVELKRVLKKEGTMWWNHGDSYANRNPTKNGGEQPANGVGSKKNKVVRRTYEPTFPEKCLMLQAHRLVIRMVDEQGWILRNQIIWHKPNIMPQSVKDRFTVDFEPIFFFSKSKRYLFDPQFEPYAGPMNRWGGDKLNAKGKSDWDKGTGQKTYRDRDMRPNKLGRNRRSVWKIATKPFREAHFATFPELLIETPIKAGCPPGGVVLDPFMGAGTVAVVALKLGRKYIGIDINPEYCKIAEDRIKSISNPLF